MRSLCMHEEVKQQMAKLPIKDGVDIPLRLRAKNIAPSTRGVGQPGQASGEWKSSLHPAFKLSLINPDRKVQVIGNCKRVSLVATLRNALLCLGVEHEITPHAFKSV
jgi:hypothetical protein